MSSFEAQVFKAGTSRILVFFFFDKYIQLDILVKLLYIYIERERERERKRENNGSWEWMAAWLFGSDSGRRKQDKQKTRREAQNYQVWWQTKEREAVLSNKILRWRGRLQLRWVWSLQNLDQGFLYALINYLSLPLPFFTTYISCYFN